MLSIPKNQETWASLFVAPLVAIVLYVPALRFDFVGWDDGAYVTLNESLVRSSGLGRIWFSSDNEQYYPLTFTTYWIEHKLWGLDPAGYHATNVILHALNAFLLGLILRSLGFGAPVTILASLIFVVHPVQVMSVAWLSARKNLLSTSFVLLATILWIRYRQRRSVLSCGGAALAFCLALLSKSAVAPIPLAWFVLDMTQFRVPLRRAVGATVGLLIPSALAVLATWYFEQKFLGDMPGFGDRILIGARALVTYAGLLIWPVGQTPIYPLWPVSSYRFLGAISIIFVLAVVYTLWLFRQCIPDRAKFGSVLAATAIFPTLGFVPFGNMLVSYVSDHYMYLPMAGVTVVLATLMSMGLFASKRAQRVATISASVFIVALTIVTWLYLPVFHDARSVWERTLAYNEASYPAHAGMARLDAAARNWTSAIYHLERAVEIEPNRREVRQSLGEAYLQGGKLAAAKSVFDDLHATHRDWAAPILGLAAVAEYSRNFEVAIRLNNEAAQLDRTNAAPLFALGRIYLGLLRREEAIVAFRRAVERAPEGATAYVGLATAYRGLGDHRSAAAALEQGLNRLPDDVAILNGLSRTLATCPEEGTRDGSRAVTLALKADAATKGQNLDVVDTLAAAYAESGDFDRAREVITKAVSLARQRNRLATLTVLESRLARYAADSPLRETTFIPLP